MGLYTLGGGVIIEWLIQHVEPLLQLLRHI